ncbi:MAG: hypothetical protein ACYTG5_01700 [Planctomycetota bacterium]
MVRSSLLRGAALSTLPLLWACSGTSESSPPPIEVSEPMAGEEVAAQPDTDAPEQDPTPQDPEQAQRLIAETLQKARAAASAGNWGEARQEAGYVLELDPENDEARQILLNAQANLGEGDPAVGRDFDDQVLQARVSLERDRQRALDSVRLGDAEMENNRPGDALDHYETALLILRYNDYAVPDSSLQRAIQVKIDNAGQLQARLAADRESAQQAASRRDLEEAERRAAIARQAQVERLLEQANRDFQLGNFSGAVTLLDSAMSIEPNNAAALALRDLAGRAQHENRVELSRQRWKAEWAKTFDELNTAHVPQTDVLKFDIERWTEVSRRRPITFAPPEDLDSPEEREIMSRLESTVLEHRFASATVQDWAKFYQDVTQVNFLVSTEVAELDEETTTLVDFNLSNRSVLKALDVIGAQTDVRWRVRDGIVELVTPDNAGGRTYLSQYEVRDLVLGVGNNPGPDLKLRVPDSEDEFTEPDEPLPTVVDDDRLQELIRTNIAPESWDGEVGTVSYLNGVLLVNHTREVHQQVTKLLNDLRQAVGIQVDVEARFLRVEDNFLEDIGVDFRGLGDQASEGVPGRGLEENNRSNLRFDDFGRPELINAAAPIQGSIGTGTEPGIFYDDGGDGDLMGRTENLFDASLAGGTNNRSASGGLSLQWAYLDDVELEVVLRAVSKQDRSEIIVAPRLLVYNNTRASMSALRHTSFIRDFDVEIAQSAAVANPVVDVVSDGVVLDVRPVVSADRRFITLELRPTLLELQTPIPTFTTTLGAGQPVSIQLPRVTLQKVRTTVTLPDGGTVLLGGQKIAERRDFVSGIPILKDIPGLSFLFSRKGQSVLNRRVLMLIKSTIIIPEEFEPEILAIEPEDFLSSSR